jgi:hypothetical protein
MCDRAVTDSSAAPACVAAPSDRELATDFLREIVPFPICVHGHEDKTRKIIHLNVTADPSAEWTLQQFREASPVNSPIGS